MKSVALRNTTKQQQQQNATIPKGYKKKYPCNTQKTKETTCVVHVLDE